ncbi:hypothetical protein D3C87_1812200 [compost metagenome]
MSSGPRAMSLMTTVGAIACNCSGGVGRPLKTRIRSGFSAAMASTSTGCMPRKVMPVLSKSWPVSVMPERRK